MRAVIILFVASFWVVSAHGLPSPLQVQAGKISAPMAKGVTIGGKAGTEFSLLGVRSETTEGGRGERLVLAYGDRFGQPHHGEPGFFHVSVDHQAKRIVIDLAQITRTAVDPARLAKILSASKLIGSSEMTMDPQDGSTNITLNLKEPVSVKVASMSQAQARLVLEILPVGAAKR